MPSLTPQLPVLCIAERIFEGQHAQVDIDEAMCTRFNAGAYTDNSFDFYDGSIEFIGCAPDMRLSREAQAWLWEQGFERCWLNHKDNMQTYYEPKTPAEGKRYPQSPHRIAAAMAALAGSPSSPGWMPLELHQPAQHQYVLVTSTNWPCPRVLQFLAFPYPRLRNNESGLWYWFPERMSWCALPASPAADPRTE
jgi:hypothetical protein